jgi:hypothetical protein
VALNQAEIAMPAVPSPRPVAGFTEEIFQYTTPKNIIKLLQYSTKTANGVYPLDMHHGTL